VIRGRVAVPHRILGPAHGPLIAVRLNVLTRKTLGGLQTTLDSQVIRSDGTPFPGLYAAGEVGRVSVGVACMATTRWRAPSWVGASFPGARPGGRWPAPDSRFPARLGRLWLLFDHFHIRRPVPAGKQLLERLIRIADRPLRATPQPRGGTGCYRGRYHRHRIHPPTSVLPQRRAGGVTITIDNSKA
jgi:hypothetical protein